MPGSTDGSLVSLPALSASTERQPLLRPPQQRDYQLWTLRDLTDHLLDSVALDGATGLHLRRAIRAATAAYLELPGMHEWSYLQRHTQIQTVASQSTGTVTYDHTGGTYERQLTLTGATWPDDVRYYRIFLNGSHYKIAERQSSTVLTLAGDSNPGVDLTGVTYMLARSIYPLPADFRRAGFPVSLESLGWNPDYVTHGELVHYQDDAAFSSRPQVFTIRNSDEEYASMVLEFAPYPTTLRTYDLAYTVSPRPVRPFGQAAEYSTGTISVSGLTVTGSGTTFSQRMVGCVIRFTTAATVPSGDVGVSEDDVPYEELAIIRSVNSATELTIDRTLNGTYSAKPYSIGDPLDIESQVMLTPLIYLAEMHFARQSDFQQEHNNPSRRSILFHQKLREAIIADARQPKLTGEQAGMWNGPLTLEALDA